MKENFKKKVLDNGMAILFEKRDFPIVSVGLGVKYGSINENFDEKGIAHFIEHMLFKGTVKRPSNSLITSEIEKVGGSMNAYTTNINTFYFCKIPNKHLKTALDVLSDMVKNPLFDKKELEKERQVIFEEIKMNHDTPMRYVFNGIEKTLFTEPFNIGILGTYESLNSINKEIMSEKFNEIYSPNNLVLVVVGNANFKEIVSFAEQNFGNKKSKIPQQEFSFENNKKIEKREGINQANLVFAYHVPTANDKKSYAAKILSTLMAEGFTSRLFHEIREKRNLAYAVKGGAEVAKDFAYNFVYVGTMKEKIELVKNIILEELNKVGEGLEEKELKETKERMIGNYQISTEDSQEQMVNLMMEETIGDAENFYDFEKNINSVNLEDVKELAKKAAKEYSFFALVPE